MYESRARTACGAQSLALMVVAVVRIRKMDVAMNQAFVFVRV